jgi:DNA-binding NtrC family response regulator/predicted TIM-barrel enzyme
MRLKPHLWERWLANGSLTLAALIRTCSGAVWDFCRILGWILWWTGVSNGMALHSLASIGSVFERGQRSGTRVIAAAVSSGEGTRAAVAAEVDLLLALNAGIYRNAGVSTLASYMPYGDANLQTREFLRQHILPHAGSVPVIAGVFAAVSDENVDDHLSELKSMGVAAVTNWPAVGLVDGNGRAALAYDGWTAQREQAVLQRAREMGFDVAPFVFHREEVASFADCGATALILVLGMTRHIDDLRERRDLVQHAIRNVNGMLDVLKHHRKLLPTLAYGGPVTVPEDLASLFQLCGVDGFAGGSVFERLPLYDVTSSIVRRFKSVAVESGGGSGDAEETSLAQIVGRSAPMEQVFRLIRRVAPHDVHVCIEGESGVGKELVATSVHRLSNRARQAFVTLNCGAIPDGLLESELFGHEKGAFTGADRRKLGKFELAHRGTLFLDEIANLSAHGQVALLRAIQQREISRVGSEQYIAADVRIVAASNQPLAELVANGKFRADLYHRLSQVTVSVPPLRERLSDLPLLIADILSRLQVQLNRKLIGAGPRFLKKLHAHGWTGNVRELQHVLLHAALMEDGPVLEGRDFVPQTFAEAGAKSPDRDDAAWRGAVLRAMKTHGGNKSRAAAELGVTRRTLYKWLGEM